MHVYEPNPFDFILCFFDATLDVWHLFYLLTGKNNQRINWWIQPLIS